jgi:hypothetical protein
MLHTPTTQAKRQEPPDVVSWRPVQFCGQFAVTWGIQSASPLVGGGSCQATAGACLVRPLSAGRCDLLSFT